MHQRDQRQSFFSSRTDRPELHNVNESHGIGITESLTYPEESIFRQFGLEAGHCQNPTICASTASGTLLVRRRFSSKVTLVNQLLIRKVFKIKLASFFPRAHRSQAPFRRVNAVFFRFSRLRRFVARLLKTDWPS
jgi:hypothetical protein